MAFSVREEEIIYLKKRDKRLAWAIEAMGAPPERESEPDVFAALVHSIVGQQISSAAQRSILARLEKGLGGISPWSVLSAGADALRGCGLSLRKAEDITELAERAARGEFGAARFSSMDDDAVIAELRALRGVGLWTAEMLLIFSLGRRDVVSFGDFGIRRGMRMLYRHKEITKELFAKYKKRYSPCGTAASLFLWQIAGGAIAELTDPAKK